MSLNNNLNSISTINITTSHNITSSHCLPLFPGWASRRPWLARRPWPRLSSRLMLPRRRISRGLAPLLSITNIISSSYSNFNFNSSFCRNRVTSSNSSRTWRRSCI